VSEGVSLPRVPQPPAATCALAARGGASAPSRGSSQSLALNSVEVTFALLLPALLVVGVLTFVVPVLAFVAFGGDLLDATLATGAVLLAVAVLMVWHAPFRDPAMARRVAEGRELRLRSVVDRIAGAMRGLSHARLRLSEPRRTCGRRGVVPLPVVLRSLDSGSSGKFNGGRPPPPSRVAHRPALDSLTSILSDRPRWPPLESGGPPSGAAGGTTRPAAERAAEPSTVGSP
jgi:hypothetical protein